MKQKPAVQEGSTVFSWRRGTRATASAQAFGELLNAIGGKVDAEQLVSLAEPKESSIHDAFEWDNKKAGHQYRLVQARYYMRSLHVTTSEEERPEPALIHVKTQEESAFVTTEQVKDNEEYIQSALSECLRQLMGLRKRYHFIGKLRGVWNAIDQAMDQVAQG